MATQAEVITKALKSNGNGRAKAISNDSLKLARNQQEFVANLMTSRMEFIRKLIDRDGKDINKECGYPDTLGADEYHTMYEREGIAARVIEVLPQESWASECDVFETEDLDNVTDFEEAWDEMDKRLNLQSEMEKLDEISGIGRYGVMLLGFDDGAVLSKPVSGVGDDGLPTKTTGNKTTIKKPRQLLYVRNFEEVDAEIVEVESDTTNPRFGQPVMYEIKLTKNDEDVTLKALQKKLGGNRGIKVHWTRMLHVADGQIFHTPRMQRVYNRLIDLRKILGGSAEMFWKGGFPGYAFNIDSDVDPESIDKAAMREEYQNYMLSLQRYMAFLGVDVTTLTVQVADPTNQVAVGYAAIAIAMGIPIRIFIGSERGELASSQDERAWAKRMCRRQDQYIKPRIVRPFVDRMMAVGVLPTIEEVIIKFAPLYNPTEGEKADIAAKVTTALAAYVSSGVDVLIAPREFLIHIMGLDEDVVTEIIDAVEEHIAELQAEADQLLADQQPDPQLDENGDPIVDPNAPPVTTPPAPPQVGRKQTPPVPAKNAWQRKKKQSEEDTKKKKKKKKKVKESMNEKLLEGEHRRPFVNVWSDEARAASAEARKGSGSHTVKLPKNPAKLSIQTAGQALAQMGYKLRAGHFDLDTKTTSYSVTKPGGSVHTMSVASIRGLVYGGAK